MRIPNELIGELIDSALTKQIAVDLISGNLFKADDETLEMVLVGVWESIDEFIANGVIIGEAWQTDSTPSIKSWTQKSDILSDSLRLIQIS